MMEHHAQRLLKLIPAEDDFISQLRQVLSEQLRCGNASLTIVSRKLAMSRRAFRENSTVRELLIAMCLTKCVPRFPQIF